MICIIDNFDSFVYNLIHYIEEKENVHVFRNDAIDWDALEECKGIVISPGPGIPDTAGAVNDVIDKFYKKKPIFGVCLGHEAIACYFGAKLRNLGYPLHGVGIDTVNLQNDPDFFNGIPRIFKSARYHSWVLSKEDLPEELMITAEDLNGNIAAFKHKTLPLRGTQFHPESVLTPEGKRMMDNWIESLKV